jgi:hypothetical protein
VAQLYPRALGSLFVASYDSQGYGGGILIRLHTAALPTFRSRLPYTVILATRRGATGNLNFGPKKRNYIFLANSCDDSDYVSIVHEDHLYNKTPRCLQYNNDIWARDQNRFFFCGNVFIDQTDLNAL